MLNSCDPIKFLQSRSKSQLKSLFLDSLPSTVGHSLVTVIDLIPKWIDSEALCEISIRRGHALIEQSWTNNERVASGVLPPPAQNFLLHQVLVLTRDIRSK